MTPRRRLALYALAVVAVSFVHAPAALAALLAAAVALAGPPRWRLLRRAALAVFAFNLTVSLGYAALAFIDGGFSATVLLRLNLRVLLLVFLGFWCVARVDLLAALAGWPLARLLATLALGQIKTFERVLGDFRLAFASRTPAPPTLQDCTRHAAAQAQALLDKSLAAAGESALALRARGAFDD